MFCQLNIDFDATSATLRENNKFSYSYGNLVLHIFGFLPQTISSSTPNHSNLLNPYITYSCMEGLEMDIGPTDFKSEDIFCYALGPK